MQYPPLKAIEAVKTKRVDSRTKHIAIRFRNFFHCFDENGVEASDEHDIRKVTLTPRAEEYWKAQGGGKSRILAV